MDYFVQELFLAAVDKDDRVIGEIERWEAHKKGILHRAFTVCLFYNDQAILQHRKHPVFDGVFDLTCSSHPYFKHGKLQQTEEAVLETLKREWNIGKDHLSSPLTHKGTAYYEARDKNSEYREHEICHFYTADVEQLPNPEAEFAYGYSCLPREALMREEFPLYNSFAPWVPPLLKLL